MKKASKNHQNSNRKNKKNSVSSVTTSLHLTLSKILAKDSLVLQRISNAWHDLVEVPLNTHSQPIKIQVNQNFPSHKTLVISCIPAAKIYLDMNKGSLLEAIQSKFGYSHITEIKVIIQRKSTNKTPS